MTSASTRDPFPEKKNQSTNWAIEQSAKLFHCFTGSTKLAIILQHIASSFAANNVNIIRVFEKNQIQDS